MKLTIKELKEIIKDMPDDALVIARDRDATGLAQVHVIGCGEKPKNVNQKIKYVKNPSDMYGGQYLEEDGVKQAIVFCDCD
jgi:hypothetical protein